MSKLKSGWKRWDLYLNKFTEYKRPIHILEIGSYKGDSALWFLDNLCNNSKSDLTCVDTWDGSPEYNDKDFESVESAFDSRIKNNPRSKQLIKIKNNSYNALIQLNIENKLYDIVYIDASHESRDVIADAVLSWKIVRPKGVVIFDDYKWDLLEPDYFTPKPAIDAFLHVMKPELKVLNIARQVFIEKLEKFEIPQRNKDVKSIYGGPASRSKSKKKLQLRKTKSKVRRGKWSLEKKK